MTDEVFKNHEILFSSEVALTLGKAHYLILEADTTLDDRTIIRDDAKAPFSRITSTPLGSEIHGDFVKWFLRKHIDNIGNLKLRVEEILPALTELKHLSENAIGESTAESYQQFMEELKALIETKKTEVDKFYEFVVWLKQIDELSPCLLFSHPTWSCSELSSRSFTIRKENVDSLVRLCV